MTPSNRSAPRSDAALLSSVLAIAALLRAFSLAAESVLPSFVHHRLDALLYHDAARSVAAGDLRLGDSVLHMSPLYSYFLGSVYALFGAGPWPARIVQSVFGLGSVALVFLSARVLLGRWPAFAAALACAVYGPLVFYEAQLSVVTLATFMTTLVLYLGVVLARAQAPSVLRCVAPFAALGGCVLLRPNALLLGLPLLLLLGHATRQLTPRARVGRCALALVVAALVIAPVTVRNRVIGGEWVLVTDSGGMNFYLGNAEGANGTFRVPRHLPEARSAQTQFDVFRAAAEHSAGRTLSARELDAHYYQLAWHDIARDPARWLRLLLEKAWLFWNARELPNTEDYEFHRLINPVLSLPLLGFGVLAPFALLGVVVLLIGRDVGGRFVAALAVMHFAALVAFFVLAHYRLPIVPALILCAAALIALLLKERRRTQLVAAACALLLTLPVVFWPKLPKPFDDEWFKLGYAYHVQGELGPAEHAYLRALEINSGNISAHKNLARLYELLHAPERASEHWQAVLQLAEQRQLAAYQDEARAALAALP